MKKYLCTFLICILYVKFVYSQVNNFVDIELLSTQPKISASESFGFIAKIRNNSLTKIVINNHSAKLLIPSEIFGTIEATIFTGKLSIDTNSHSLTLHPDEEIIVYWYDIKNEFLNNIHKKNITYLNKFLNGMLRFLKLFLFEPGNYNIIVTLQGKLHNSEYNEYETLCASKIFYVHAPARSLLFGGGIGGFLGYILLELRRKKNTRKNKKLKSHISASLGAILLGSISTILVSPLSQTDFIVTIKITQFWSAIAFGFTIEMLGMKFFSKFLTPFVNAISTSKIETQELQDTEDIE